MNELDEMVTVVMSKRDLYTISRALMNHNHYYSDMANELERFKWFSFTEPDREVSQFYRKTANQILEVYKKFLLQIPLSSWTMDQVYEGKRV